MQGRWAVYGWYRVHVSGACSEFLAASHTVGSQLATQPTGLRLVQQYVAWKHPVCDHPLPLAPPVSPTAATRQGSVTTAHLAALQGRVSRLERGRAKLWPCIPALRCGANALPCGHWRVRLPAGRQEFSYRVPPDACSTAGQLLGVLPCCRRRQAPAPPCPPLPRRRAVAENVHDHGRHSAFVPPCRRRQTPTRALQRRPRWS